MPLQVFAALLHTFAALGDARAASADERVRAGVALCSLCCESAHNRAMTLGECTVGTRVGATVGRGGGTVAGDAATSSADASGGARAGVPSEMEASASGLASGPSILGRGPLDGGGQNLHPPPLVLTGQVSSLPSY